jgi:hypothetical protein
MDTIKVFLAGGAAVVILGAGVWVITQKDAQTGEVLGEKTVNVEEQKADATATPEPTPTPVATEAATPKPTPKPVTSLTLSATAKSDGVYLSWKPTTSSDFKYYKIVRSKTNSSPKYPEDGYIYYSEDRALSSYVDKESVEGYAYYYRICAVAKSDGEVTCGNVVKVTSLGGKVVEKATPKPEAKAGYTPITSALQLTTTKTEAGVVLDWTPYVGTGFNYYKVVRSKTNSDLYYPNDGYIYVGSDQNSSAYVDESAEVGISYFYRICVKANDAVLCGNVMTVTR